MRETCLILGALVCIYVGFAWLALAMRSHWVQVSRSQALRPFTAATLRVLGTVSLLASLTLCLAADSAAMAALVWTMALAVCGAAVAFTLTWRPRWLKVLVPRRLAE
jgi:hypothetical protein